MPHATCKNRTFFRIYFKAQRAPNPDRKVGLAVDYGCAALGTFSCRKSPPVSTGGHPEVLSLSS